MWINLESLMKELERVLSQFRCFTDDKAACDAAQEASLAYETGKVALKRGIDTEYARCCVSKAIKRLRSLC